MDNVTLDISQRVKEWNNKIVQSLIPNNTILSMYMVAGLLGNSLVIFIYGFKMKGNKEDRYFIPFLAMADLWASLICASFGIAQNMMQATFDDEQLCKTWWFFAAFSTLTSVFFLLIVAVHRYLKVCQPLGRQMTLAWKRFALLIGLITAFILAVPMTYFYGSDPFLNEELGIHGLRCSRLSSANKTGSLIFGGLLLLITITIIVSLICLYSKIGLKIRDHLKRTKINRRHKTVEHSQGGVSNSDDRLSYTERDTQSRDTDDRTEDTGLSTVHRPTSTCRELEVVTSTKNNGGKYIPKLSSVKRRKRKRVVYKFTLMFMLITVIFLICYIPKTTIMLLEARKTSFWEEFSYTGRSVLLFVYRIYILNNITNPIIYAFLDKKFTKEIKKCCVCK